ncbi:MAG: hypothetical protein A4E72_01842 [Syntrophus sp. PtaU1.Bin208]|nr:MAG: hypothetical protein A4E72_01842 [Syntrophus sp. PtaU1.Bin208]
MVKKYAWGSVQLADNDSFRSIDNEGPLFGHKGNLTEVDFLLLDVSDVLLIGHAVRIKNNESYDNLQGSRIGHPFLNALVDVITYSPYFITYKFQRTFPTEIRNGKYAFKSTLQAVILTIFRSVLLLEKCFVRPHLNVNEVGNFQNFFYTAKVFSKFAHGIPKL